MALRQPRWAVQQQLRTSCGALPSGLVDAIRNGVAAKLVDGSDLVDAIKAIKSPEEIALLRATAAMQDTLFAKVAALGKRGASNYRLLPRFSAALGPNISIQATTPRT